METYCATSCNVHTVWIKWGLKCLGYRRAPGHSCNLKKLLPRKQECLLCFGWQRYFLEHVIQSCCTTLLLVTCVVFKLSSDCHYEFDLGLPLLQHFCHRLGDSKGKCLHKVAGYK